MLKLQPVMLIIFGTNGTNQKVALYLISCSVLVLGRLQIFYDIADSIKIKFRQILLLDF